jgi:hypothetical protein
LLTFSEQFDVTSAWDAPAVVVSPNFGASPVGDLTADKIVENLANSEHVAYNKAPGLTAPAGSYTSSVYLKAAGRNFGFVQVAVNGAASRYGVVVDLSTGAVTATNSIGTPTGISYNVSSAGNGWWRISTTATHTSGTIYIVSGPSPTGTPSYTASGTPIYTGDGTSGVLIWGAQLELGSTATNYQRVTTQHDVTEAGVASVGYLYFDGADDAMVTSSVNFTSTNKMTAFAGYRAILKTGSAMMFELSSVNSNVGSFSLNQGPIAGTTGFGALMNTGSVVGAQTDPLTIPYTSVASLKLDSALVGTANEISLRMNGTATPLPNIIGSDSGTGNFGNYPFYIGARNGSQFHFAGHIYSLIARGAFTDAPTIASTETYVAGKTGIVI